MAEGDLQSILPDPEPSLVPRPPAAWNPFTPAGIAAFASATFQRLFLVECLVALLASATLLWFILSACLPTLRAAIQQLPDAGRIEGGQWVTPPATPALLAESRILALVADPSRERRAGLQADFQVALHRTDFEICSLLGCLALRYPASWTLELNRKDLGPRLDAWGPMVCVIVGLATVLSLFMVWACLASIYAPVAWLIALYHDRQLSLAGGWRLSAAALMPGALMMCAGQVLYGLGYADLIRIVILLILHFPVGWAYLVFATRRLPRASDMEPKGSNPFEPPSATPPSDNPFAPR
jgi:hypothetical protein